MKHPGVALIALALCAACAATPRTAPAPEQSCTIRTTAADPMLDLAHRTINLLHGRLCLYPVTGAAAPIVTTAEKPPPEVHAAAQGTAKPP